ncbi:10961_t:CDS:2, partial [Acaulospora morrowiae]
NFPELFFSETVVVIPKRMTEYHYYRTLWWEKGDFNPKAKLEETDKLTSMDIGNGKCDPVFGTDGSIIPSGAIRTRADDSEKDGDASFRPEKPRGEPWPNIVIGVVYSEIESHVLEKLKDFWLRNWSRVHDAIVVKIDKPPEEDQYPLRMQASCIPKLSSNMQSEINLLRQRVAELEAENTKLRQVMEENAKREAENTDLKAEV